MGDGRNWSRWSMEKRHDRSVIIRGGRVAAPSEVLVDGWVLIEGERITAIGRPDGASAPTGEAIDAAGGWVVPGLIDLQVNGGAGIDVTTEPARIDELGEDLVRQGVTAFLPTVITAPPPHRGAALEAWRRRSPCRRGASPLGLHFEGPMLSPQRLGAHPVEHVVAPAADVIAGWSPDAGVAMVTLAPELPGALDVISELTRRGVIVALGHTDATADVVARAVDAGASYVTHLFNAMRPFGHRDPGPVGATLGGDGLIAGLIADGVHVDRAAVRTVWRALGPERTTLVTDAVAARDGSRMPAVLGSVELAPGDGPPRTAGGVLAGSVLTLDAALRNLVQWTGCSVPDAVATVTSTPAAVLGCRDRGVLRVGARADVVVLDAGLEVRAVVVGGQLAWERDRS